MNGDAPLNIDRSFARKCHVSLNTLTDISDDVEGLMTDAVDSRDEH